MSLLLTGNDLEDLIQGVRLVEGEKIKDRDVSYWLGRVKNMAIAAQRKLEKAIEDIYLKQCKRDEAGRPMFVRTGERVRYDFENQAEVNKLVIAEREKVIELPVDVFPLPLDRFDGIEWTPAKMAGLDLLIKEPKTKGAGASVKPNRKN